MGNRVAKTGGNVTELDRSQPYWYCGHKNAMVDKNDCRTCQYGTNK